MFVRPKGVCTLCTLLCTGGSFDLHLVPSWWFCLRRFMQVCVAGDMTLRPGLAFSLNVPGSAGTSPAVTAGGARSVSRVEVCGIQTLLPGRGPGLVDPYNLSVAERVAIVFLPAPMVSAGPA